MNRFTRTIAILLAGALQVLPLLRNIVTSPAAGSTFAIILRWTVGSAATIGAVDAVSGATSTFTSPATFSGSVGTPFSNNVVVSIGGGNKAAKDDYFILSSGSMTSPLLLNGQSTSLTLPPGLTFMSSWVNGASTIGGVIYGTPTTAGAYPTKITVVSPGNASLSQNVTITIGGSTGPTAPAITSQPASTNIIAGRTATFTVGSSGTAPLSYFWFKGNSPLANGGNISGAATATLSVANVTATDTGNYSVIVSNSVGTATSAVAAVTVILPPAISSQPTGLTNTAGSNVQFSVTATGSTPLAYRWMKNGLTLANGAKFSGVNTNTLSIAGISTAEEGNYSVAITNLAGSITSSIAPLVVVSPPSILTPPTNQTVIIGTGVSFNVSASGSAPMTYRWLKNTSLLADGGNISGSATATLTLSSVSTNDAASYSVTISNSVGGVISPAASLTVLVPPSIVTAPNNANVIAGSNVTFTVTASGSPTLNYQWSKNGSVLANGGNVSGVTTASLSLANVSATDAATYSVTVTNTAGASSSSATLNVLGPPGITSQPTNVTVALGKPATFNATATGTGPLIYQWMKNNSPIPGANSNVLAFAAVTTNDAASYLLVVTNTAGTASSSSATLTVLVPPSIVTPPTNANVVAGSNVTFTITASGSPTLTFQWSKNGTVLANGGNVSGAATASLSLANVSATDAATYSVIVSNAVGSASSSATLTVLGPPAFASQPTNVTVATGKPATFSVTATGTGPLIYQWMKNNSPIPGANSNVLSFAAVTTNDTASYLLVVTNSVGTATSSSATLTVLVPPAVVTPLANTNVVAGSNVTFTVTAGGSPTLVYQWRKNGNVLANGGTVSGATSASLSLANVSATDAATYSVIVSNAVGSASSSAVLTVVAPPVITTQPTNQIAGLDASVSLNVTASGTGPLSYQWFKGTNKLVNGGNISGSVSNILTISTLTTNEEDSYFVVVSNYLGSVVSSNASIAISNSIIIGGNAPVIVENPASQIIAQNNTVTLAVTATGADPMGYQWLKQGKKLADKGNLSGATSSTLVIHNCNAKNSGSYSVVVANSHGSANSALANLTVLAPPVINKSPTDRAPKAGGNAVFKVNAKGGKPLSYQWFKDGIALVDGGNISGSKAKALKISALTQADTATYSVIVSNLVGSATSGNALLTVLLPPSPASASQAQLINSPTVTANTIAPVVLPIISQIAKNDTGGITLTCTGKAGAVYILQATPDLITWSNVYTNTVDANGHWQATDTVDAPCRFYRIQVTP